MNIQFYNTLTNRLETFEPLEPGRVRMYSCGPTVYDFAHIGNFRSFLFGDLLRRFLEAAGNKVHHVMNITDVGHMTDDEVADGGGEDKMEVAIKKMKADKKSGKVPEGAIEDENDPFQIARYFTDSFLEDSRKLGYKVAFEYPDNVPKATDHIQGMLDLIQKLLDRGHAYVADDGVVYYSVESFPRYGELSGNTLEKLQSGAGGRVSEENQALKRHPADFMLWKPDERHLMKWDSPWGIGYPGWHIECSVMAMKLLGSDVIDIHTGGEDLIFPHHECEIAQSCGASGADHFARYWIHARFLFVEGEKMSKSKGNFYTARDIFNGAVTEGRPVHPAVLRYELIKSHYRDNMNFTARGLVDSANIVRKVTEFRAKLESEAGGQAEPVDASHPIVNQFLLALADDLNISKALGVFNPWVGTKQEDPHVALGALNAINQVLAIAPVHEQSATDDASDEDDPVMVQAKQWCREMDSARKAKDFTRADELRTRILDAGFEVRTTKQGTVIHKKLV